MLDFVDLVVDGGQVLFLRPYIECMVHAFHGIDLCIGIVEEAGVLRIDAEEHVVDVVVRLLPLVYQGCGEHGAGGDCCDIGELELIGQHGAVVNAWAEKPVEVG